MPEKFLIIQTAFTGDVILATALIEKIRKVIPGARIDFLLRKGNETLLENYPSLGKVWIWNKKEHKLRNLLGLIQDIRKEKYTCVLNVHRFASSGFITALSGAPQKIGFDKNPLSIFYTLRVKHEIGNGKHETERNQQLIRELTGDDPEKPRLYPSPGDYKAIQRFQTVPYICIAPGSVWFTKTFPAKQWSDFINTFSETNKAFKIFLLGSSAEKKLCDQILNSISSGNTVNLAGELSFLESAALMKNASMNYVNDSAPLHIASAMNAPVTAVYCSTLPAFGFGPLSDLSYLVETAEHLDCRPCGLHGFRECPKGHFKCATTIQTSQLLQHGNRPLFRTESRSGSS